MSLPTTPLGRTGLQVSRLGYGAGHRKPMDDARRDRIHNAVLDYGINLIDTSDDYGLTYDDEDSSERLIGRYISHRRSEYYIATKCGGTDGGHDWTRENVFRNLHDSLESLRVDYVDLMQLHGATVAECEREGLVESLIEMKEQGKTRWIGASTNLPDLPIFLDWGVFDVFQLPYSALERDHEGWITRAAEAGAGILIRGGVALGEHGVGSGDRLQWSKFQEAGLDDFRGENESRSAFLLRFTMTHPHAHCNLVGTTDPDHLRENVQAALRGPLPADLYEEAMRRLDGVGVTAA